MITKKKNKSKNKYKSKINIVKNKVIKFTLKTHKCAIINKNQMFFLYLYFGIMSKIISGAIELNISYNLFYSKNDKKQKLLNNTKSFTLINKVPCFFYTSNIPSNHNTDILLCNVSDNKDNYMYICFASGITNYYNTTKSLLYYISKKVITDNIKYQPKFYELIILLSQIKYYLDSNKYKKIILCGHSRGITVATVCAYILLILSSGADIITKYPKHHNVKEFLDKLKEYILDSNNQEIILNNKLIENKNNKIIYNKLLEEIDELHKFNIICNDILNLKLIKNKIQNKIYICGTGGYPILWTNIEDFTVFNNFYEYKYLHIISGNKEHNIQSYDNLTYYNKFIYIFSNIENIKYINYIPTKIDNLDKGIDNLDKEIEKFKNIKNINYVYKNFGSIILNLINSNKIECYMIDTIFNKLQKYDKINKNINFNTNKLMIYHRFEFYRYLFSKYMNFL